MNRHAIAITMGDPAGVGPELCIKLLRHLNPLGASTPVIFGDASILKRAAASLGIEFDLDVLAMSEWMAVDPARLSPSVVEASDVELFGVKPGVVDQATGQASFDFVEAAIQSTKMGVSAAVVTGPIHKEAWNQAGITFPGHTELFADRCNAERSCMMLTSDEVTCSFVTSHVGLYEVPNKITKEAVLQTIELTNEAMLRILDRPPKISVCGLNPHAGEQGLFGRREEERFITPAIDIARSSGISVRGPLPADTAFLPELRKETDAYICMYHDQGLVVLKALAFDRAVNVTLGLPIVRTSVDHGTALDLAWKGIASHESLCEAFHLAQRLIEIDQSRRSMTSTSS